MASNTKLKNIRKLLKKRTERNKCRFTRSRVYNIDWKDVALLRKYMSDRGKIRARRINGNCERHQKMLSNIRRGDVVVTNGGLIGKVTKAVDENEIEIEIAPNVRVRQSRSAISDVRAKGEPVKDSA